MNIKQVTKNAIHLNISHFLMLLVKNINLFKVIFLNLSNFILNPLLKDI